MLVDIKTVSKKIEDGELDDMDANQFMVFMQKVTRAFTTQRDVPYQERTQILDKYNNYVKDRLVRDQIDSIAYLHEVGDLVTLSYNNRRQSMQNLRKQLSQTVMSCFEDSTETPQ